MISNTKKIFTLTLFALIFLIIAFSAFTQTSYFKNRLKEYLVEKSALDLTIKELEGIFPFWMRAKEVTLTIEDSKVRVEKSSFTLSPLALFQNKLSFIHLKLENVEVESPQNEAPLLWPTLPFSLQIYSLEIVTLSYNKQEPLNISGAIDVEPEGGDFSLTLNVRKEQLLLHLNVTGDAETEEVALITNMRLFNATMQEEALNLWSGGTLSLKDKLYRGKIYSKGAYNIDDELMVELSLASKEFLAEGMLLEKPLLLRGNFAADTLYIKELSYLGNTITGKVSYKRTELHAALHEIEQLAPFLKRAFDYEVQLQGDLTAELIYANKKLACRAKVNQFRWDDFYLGIGEIEGRWTKDTPFTFTLSLEGFDILHPNYEPFPTIGVEAEGTLTKNDLKLQGKAKGLGEVPIALRAAIPLKDAFLPHEIDRSKPFSIKLSGRGSIDPVLAFLENASLIVKGTIDADLELSGYWDDPQISGYMTFVKGEIQDLTTGAYFQDVEMKSRGEGNKILIDSLTAKDTASGKVRGSGEIIWEKEKPTFFAIHFTAESFLLFALDQLTATTDAAITLSGTFEKILVAGEVTITKGLITIPDKLPVTIPTLEVTYINAPLLEEQQVEPTSPVVVEWDVVCAIPKKIEIKGRGFFSDWKGDLHIKGSGDERTYSGELTLLEGRFDFARNSFHLDKGHIKVEGIEPKNFYVDVEGSTEVQTLVVFMKVKGYLNDTNMTFSSTPPMSTEQIFSRLLFGSDLNELTAFQACRLAKFLVTLSGKYAGPSTFDAFKDSVGIDVFDITHCDIDSMDFTFQVGKYISQGTYVGVNKSISGDFDSVEIQTRLYHDFFLQADYGGSLNGLTPNGGKIIFKWYKTY